MAFWNSRDDDEPATDAADRLQAAAIGAPPPVSDAPARPGAPLSLLGAVAAAVAVLIALAFLFPSQAHLLDRREPWTPRGDAVYASQRLADIAAQQRLADARAAAWEDVPAVDAHVGTFAARTPPR